METKIKLTLYPSIELPLIYKQLIEMIKVNRFSKIAFAPADNLTLEIIRNLKYHKNIPQEVFVYDIDFMKDFPYKVYTYNDVKKHRPDKIFVLSLMHNKKIEERFLSLGVEKETLINLYKNNDDLLTIDEALDLIFSLSDDDKRTEYLYALLGEDNIAIINCPVFIYDIYEKINILQNNLQMKIVFLDAVLQPEIDKGNGAVRANASHIINYIRMRNNKSNILFLSAHALWRLVILYLLRTAFPDIKIVAYIYDWINLFCPYEHKGLLKEYLKLPMDYIESEYKVMDMILENRIANGIMHKDGGDEFPVLKNCSSNRLFLPACVSQHLYQEPEKDIVNLDRFILFQSLYSPSSHTTELFDDVFLFDVFRDILKQDFLIDVYYIRSSEDVVNEYRKYFKDDDNIRFIKGKPLNELLPEIAGRYHWGYMIYRSDFKIVKQHVEASLPSRIFTYAALGIPIVITEDLRFSAEFIMKNGIGVVISKNDIPDLRAILREVDYSRLQRNIFKFREKYSMERYEKKFAGFIQQCMK